MAVHVEAPAAPAPHVGTPLRPACLLPHPPPQATPLSQMPLGFVLAVTAAAAFPLDAWFDEESKESWLAAEFWRQINWGF